MGKVLFKTQTFSLRWTFLVNCFLFNRLSMTCMMKIQAWNFKFRMMSVVLSYWFEIEGKWSLDQMWLKHFKRKFFILSFDLFEMAIVHYWRTCRTHNIILYLIFCEIWGRRLSFFINPLFTLIKWLIVYPSRNIRSLFRGWILISLSV